MGIAEQIGFKAKREDVTYRLTIILVQTTFPKPFNNSEIVYKDIQMSGELKETKMQKRNVFKFHLQQRMYEETSITFSKVITLHLQSDYNHIYKIYPHFYSFLIPKRVYV